VKEMAPFFRRVEVDSLNDNSRHVLSLRGPRLEGVMKSGRNGG
jgi:hypothetical protein